MPLDKRSLKTLLVFLKVDVLDASIAQYQHINTLSINSREVNANTLFLAVPGTQASGHTYIDNAAQNGATLAFVDTANHHEHGAVRYHTIKRKSANILKDSASSSADITVVYIHNLQAQLADIAYCFYAGEALANNSTKQLIALSAVTGTNGKTSVASLMAQLTSLCRQPCASIGTLGLNVFTHGAQQKLCDSPNTTPDIVSLIDMLVQAKQARCTSAVLEASSHGLAQNRLSKLFITCSIFTNLSQDHLDYHGSMAAYAQAKRSLLKCDGVNIVVLNHDDAESLNWQHDISNEQQLYWFSLSSLPAPKQGCWASDVHYTTQGITFILHANIHNNYVCQGITIPLIGEFNVANLLASATALIAQGVPFLTLASACASVSGVAGRMEMFSSQKATVLVDYAHTPDALRQALLAARVHTTGTLSCIFGCGGNRDTTKRAIMGAIAQQYADNVVLTQDNSRSESSSAIVADIRAGMRSARPNQRITVELDREQAIANTWQHSKAGDMILVAGKGHEDYIEINNTRIAYNEREVVKRLLSAQAITSEVQQGGVQ